MSDMEEISFWVYTKRAPCLYNYDNLIKRQLAAAQRPASSPSDVLEVPATNAKTKRKLSLLGDESASPEKQQNVYFETSQNNQRTVLSSCKSDTLHSDVDFNIKNSSIQIKPKRVKLQKNRTLIHKKNKVVTSTPKPEPALRRSLRRSQRAHDISYIDTSFELTNTASPVKHGYSNNKQQTKKTPQKIKRQRRQIEKNADGDHSTKISIGLDKIQKNGIINRPFEDLSDVSGFTANYIRSTKVHTTQNSRNLRSKNKSNRDSRQHTTNASHRKAANTGQTARADGVNCSSDSSQNVINFITTKSNDKSRRDKSTSLRKFVDARSPTKADNNTSRETNDLNISYPCSRGRNSKLHKNTEVTETDSRPTESTGKRRLRPNKCITSNDRKENPDDSLVSRTRSGRSIGLRQLENSVLVFNNSTEQISSGLTLNVAQCNGPSSPRRKRCLFKGVSEQRPSERSDLALLRRPAVAGLSDSDADGEMGRQRKFFC